MNRKKSIQPAVTLAELEASAEFQACTAKQQAWLRELLANGFKFTDATVAAFNCANRRNARIRSVAVRKSPNVRAALALLLGKSEADLVHESHHLQIARLLREVNRNLRAAEPGSVAAQRLLSQKEGLIRSLAADEIKIPPAAPQVSDPRIPSNALKVWLGDHGEVVGYRDANGEDVRL